MLFTRAPEAPQRRREAVRFAQEGTAVFKLGLRPRCVRSGVGFHRKAAISCAASVDWARADSLGGTTADSDAFGKKAKSSGLSIGSAPPLVQSRREGPLLVTTEVLVRRSGDLMDGACSRADIPAAPATLVGPPARLPNHRQS